MKTEEQQDRNCCPICGHEFDDVQEWNECPTVLNRGGHGMGQAEAPTRNHFHRDELITSNDDYLWCQ
jgi:hypothetical protein